MSFSISHFSLSTTETAKSQDRQVRQEKKNELLAWCLELRSLMNFAPEMLLKLGSKVQSTNSILFLAYSALLSDLAVSVLNGK